MKQFSKKLSSLVIAGLVSMTLAQSGLAQVFYPVTGSISEINSELVIIRDTQYNLSPTARITLKKNQPGKVSDLRKGDRVGATLIRINNRRLIDSITVLDVPAAKAR